MHEVKYNTIDYKTHYISSANSYRFRHQEAIITEFINSKCFISNKNFRHYSPSLSSKKCLIMIKPQITHQELYENVAATSRPPRWASSVEQSQPLLCEKKAVIVCTLNGAFCWFLELWNFTGYLCINHTSTNKEKGMSDATCKKHCFEDFTNCFWKRERPNKSRVY